MKRQLILSLAIIFTMALFVPAVSYAFESSPTVFVDNKEKKDETKSTAKDQSEKKAESTSTEKKACCDKAKTEAGCKDASKSETKACTGEKKACCESKK